MRPFATRCGGLLAGLLWLVTLAGCAPAAEEPERTPDPAGGDTGLPGALAASLQAETFADSARFSLRVTNASEEPVELTFPTGQSFDFHVLAEGREVWRWSGDQVFTQAVRQERLAPGETRSFTAVWTPPAGTQGEFAVRGFLTAQEQRLEQQTTFQLP